MTTPHSHYTIMSTTPQPEQYASSEPTKCKIMTHITPDATQYDVPAKRQHTSSAANTKRSVPNAPSSSMTQLSINTATSVQAAVTPSGTMITRNARRKVFSLEEDDDVQLTAIGANKVIHMDNQDKDTNVHVQCTEEASKGPVLSRKQQLKVIPAQATPTPGKSRKTAPAPIRRSKSLASATTTADLLLESNNDDEKEFSELYNYQIRVAKELMTYRPNQS